MVRISLSRFVMSAQRGKGRDGCRETPKRDLQGGGGGPAQCSAGRLHAGPGHVILSLWGRSRSWAWRRAWSLLSSWRLYLCIFATGIAMHGGWIALPEHLHQFDVLANPWVIGVAGVAALAEFLADKVMWIDSAWDAVHTLIRPVGGALLALAIVDPGDPKWQVIALLLGGGASLLTHSAKAGARAVVNASPEPVSNAVLSTTEDVATGGLLLIALANPIAALLVAAILIAGAIAMLLTVRRLMRWVMRLGAERQ